MLRMTGEQIVAIVGHLPAILASVAALVAALRANRAAQAAKDEASQATVKAERAAREQVNFALRDAARRGSVPTAADAVAKGKG